MKFVLISLAFLLSIGSTEENKTLIQKLKLSVENYDSILLRDEFQMEHDFNIKNEVAETEKSLQDSEVNPTSEGNSLGEADSAASNSPRDLNGKNAKKGTRTEKTGVPVGSVSHAVKDSGAEGNLLPETGQPTKRTQAKVTVPSSVSQTDPLVKTSKIDFGYDGDSRNYSSHKRLQMEKNQEIDSFRCNRDFLESFGLDGVERPLNKRNMFCPSLHRSCCSPEDITKSMDMWVNKDKYFVEKYYETYLLTIRYLLGWEGEVRKLATAFKPTGNHNNNDVVKRNLKLAEGLKQSKSIQ